ncbi:MAG TPA: SAM-dependent methyltransferase, partial [Oligoflexia bacterium]|nr:SAM-dependent methyltransferase [Oligoflexia bacterium]
MNVKATPKSSACHRRIDCRLCGSKTLTQVLKLAPTPPANALVTKEQLGESEERFPLDVFICDACSHVQLLDVVNPEVLFRNYVYVSGTSPVF